MQCSRQDQEPTKHTLTRGIGIVRNNLVSLTASAQIRPFLVVMITSAQNVGTASESGQDIKSEPCAATDLRTTMTSLPIRSVYFQDQSKRIQNRMILL